MSWPGISQAHFHDISALTQTPLPPPVPIDVQERLLTFSKNWNKPIRPWVEIRDVEDFELLVKPFDPWDIQNGGDAEILINRIECVDAAGQTGQFSMQIVDHEHNLDLDKVGNSNWVIIKMGRNSSQLQNAMYGICKTMDLLRGRGDTQYWNMGGYGSGIILAETLLDVDRDADITDLNAGTLNQDDETMFANNLIRDILTNPEYPTDEAISVADRGQYDLSRISDKVIDLIPSVHAQRVEAGSLCTNISNVALADFGIDNYNRVVFEYESSRHSGVTVKQYVDEEAPNDVGSKTSYFQGNWSASFSNLKEVGFTNSLDIGKGKIREQFASSVEANSYVSLFNKDLSQRFPATAEFRDIAVFISKVGGGSPSKTKLHGQIRVDKDGLPTGSKVAVFDIPIASIPVGDQPNPIFITNVDFNANAIVGDYLQLIFFEIGDSEDRTIRWWHNNKFPGFNTTDQLQSCIRPLPNGRNGSNPDLNSPDGWLKNANGPQFTYSVFQVFQFRGNFSDPLSIKKYRRVVTPFDPPWTDDLLTTAQAAMAQLQISARRRADYSMNQVFVPEEYYFPVGDRILIEDEHSGHTKEKAYNAKIAQRRILWDANDNRLGTHWFQILPFAYETLFQPDMTCGVVE